MYISKEENTSFYELLHNKDIIIRPADKYSGIVVVNRDDYIHPLVTEMEGCCSYEETDVDLTEDTQKKVKRLVNKMNREGVVSDDLKKYLMPRYVQACKLKGNPKLHKPSVPYRTIVNGKGTPTENRAEVAEYELREFVKTSPS